jgi:mitochondrial fission process protein 1
MTDNAETSSSQSCDKEQDKDIFRDTPVRFLGYANEVGEAFRPIFPKFVTPSYGVAFAYVAADAFDKTLKASRRGETSVEVIRTGVDALLWQTLASVFIPGFTINMVTSGALKVFKSEKAKRLPMQVRTWSPTLIGLATVPLIIHPIDEGVDMLFDATIRKWWK